MRADANDRLVSELDGATALASKRQRPTLAIQGSTRAGVFGRDESERVWVGEWKWRVGREGERDVGGREAGERWEKVGGGAESVFSCDSSVVIKAGRCIPWGAWLSVCDC